jgi:hypothetical protein
MTRFETQHAARYYLNDWYLCLEGFEKDLDAGEIDVVKRQGQEGHVRSLMHAWMRLEAPSE